MRPLCILGDLVKDGVILHGGHVLSIKIRVQFLLATKRSPRALERVEILLELPLKPRLFIAV